MFPVLEGCVVAAPLLVVDGAGQFPKRDLATGWPADWVVVTVPREAVPAAVLLNPEKEDGATVELLVVRLNTEVVLLAERVEAVEVAETGEGCGKMGLKLWRRGLLSEEAAAEEVVVAAAKMGLNPAVRRGFVVLTGWELLAGAAAVEAEGAEVVLSWFDSPNRVGPVKEAAGMLVGALET